MSDLGATSLVHALAGTHEIQRQNCPRCGWFMRIFMEAVRHAYTKQAQFYRVYVCENPTHPLERREVDLWPV